MSKFKLNRRVNEMSRRIMDPRAAIVAFGPAKTDDAVPVLAEAYQPTPKQRKLLAALFDPKCRDMSIQDMCKVAGVSRETYYQATKNPGFVASIKAYAIDAVKGKAPKYIAIAERFADEGSWPHLRALLAMSGVYDEKLSLDIDTVRTVLQPRGERG